MAVSQDILITIGLVILLVPELTAKLMKYAKLINAPVCLQYILAIIELIFKIYILKYH